MGAINPARQDFPSSGKYADALGAIEGELADDQRQCLLEHYRSPARTLTARQLAEKMGWAGPRGFGVRYGGLAGKLYDALGVSFEGDKVYILAWYTHDPDYEKGECQF